MEIRTATHESWSSRLAFLMAAIGAAVGLGNIWKFPYTLGSGGGSAFVLVYVLAIVIVATPIMIAEMVMGRRGRMSAPNTIRKLAPKTQHDYVQRVKDFAAFLGRSPATAGKEDVRRYQLDIDSKRMLLRVEQGKGRKDR